MRIIREYPDPDIKWDLYWSMADDRPELQWALEKANADLTSAAIKAVEKGDRSIWDAVSEKYLRYGAGDTEPRWQFMRLWDKYSPDSVGPY